jgi:hypothetical protein
MTTRGVSARQLRYNLSRSSILLSLRESGVDRRYQSMANPEVDRAIALYSARSTMPHVVTVLGRPNSTIQTALARRGVVRRRRHDYR